MKLLVVKQSGKDLSTNQIEVEKDTRIPMIKSWKVLTNAIASAINLSDDVSWFRCDSQKFPYTNDKEGSGIIVQLGGGMAACLRSSKKLVQNQDF